jgi:hypothetical protein
VIKKSFLAGRSGPLPLAAWLKLQGAMPILSELNIQKKRLPFMSSLFNKL